LRRGSHRVELNARSPPTPPSTSVPYIRSSSLPVFSS
jgi:hypothetical protein